MILSALLEIAENLGPEHQHHQDSYHLWFGVVERFGLLGTEQDQRGPAGLGPLPNTSA